MEKEKEQVVQKASIPEEERLKVGSRIRPLYRRGDTLERTDHSWREVGMWRPR